MGKASLRLIRATAFPRTTRITAARNT